jgi:hypothetical protein
MKTTYKKKDGINCLKATDNQNWWSSVDTKCSSLEGYSNISGKFESFDNFGKQYEEMTLANISDISNIQELEKTIYDKLNKEGLNNEQKKMLTSELLQLNMIKGNLYNTINNLYDTYKNQVGTTSQAVSDQLSSIKLVETELNDLAVRTRQLNDENLSKLRLIEINRYYGEKYDDHSEFMKSLIIFIIFYLLLYLLKKNFLIKENVHSILLFILIFIAIIVLGRKFYRMMFRNNMDYNEYQFPFADMMGMNLPAVTTDTNNDVWINPNLPTACPTTQNLTTQDPIIQDSTTDTPIPNETQIVWENNGSVSCETYCGGTGGKSWNNELPNEWNGARCIQTFGSAENAGCNNTFDTFDPITQLNKPGSCNCQKTGTGWN